MSMSDWFAAAAVTAAAVCGVKYLVRKIKNRHRGGCKGCPYEGMCGRECEKDGK